MDQRWRRRIREGRRKKSVEYTSPHISARVRCRTVLDVSLPFDADERAVLAC